MERKALYTYGNLRLILIRFRLLLHINDNIFITLQLLYILFYIN